MIMVGMMSGDSLAVKRIGLRPHFIDYYFYNEEGLIAEADATGQLTKSYGYAPGSTFSTSPLWQKSGTAYYTYQNDHLGTPMKLLSQSGQVVWSATYDAFGKATVNPASTITNNLRFPGQYFDVETNIYYNLMRYYDPEIGRYSTSDLIGLYGGINTYLYAGGNPVNFFDPFGLAKVERLKYELEIDIVKQPAHGLPSLKQEENYKIFVMVDDKCIRKIKSTFVGRYGPVTGGPSITKGMYFSVETYVATTYEFVGCDCETTFSREEHTDYPWNWLLDIIRSFK